MSNDSGLNVPHKTSLVHIPRQLIEMWADCRLSCTCVQSNIWKSCLEYKDDLTEGFCWDMLRVLSTEHTFFVFTNRGIYTHQTKCYQIQKSLLTSVHPVLFGVMFMSSEWRQLLMKRDIQIPPQIQSVLKSEWYTDSSAFIQRRDMNKLITFQPGVCVCVRVHVPPVHV